MRTVFEYYRTARDVGQQNWLECNFVLARRTALENTIERTPDK